MGWALSNNACSNKSQPIKESKLTALLSSQEDADIIKSFIGFLRNKNLNFIPIILVNGKTQKKIKILNETTNTGEIIFEGENLSEEDFDSLYKKIPSLYR